MSKKKSTKKANSRRGESSLLRNPLIQLFIVVLVGIAIYLIAFSGGKGNSSIGREISVDEAYTKYQSGVFLLDVRTQEEWDEYHVADTTLIPLDELESRLNELPKDREIVVICRSGNRSQQGRDILLDAGFNAVSMAGGLKQWYADGHPVVGAPIQ